MEWIHNVKLEWMNLNAHDWAFRGLIYPQNIVNVYINIYNTVYLLLCFLLCLCCYLLPSTKAYLCYSTQVSLLSSSGFRHLTESGDTKQIESGNCLILIVHQSEGFKGEKRLLRHPIDLHHSLRIPCIPSKIINMYLRKLEMCQCVNGYILHLSHSPHKQAIMAALHWTWTCCCKASFQQHIEPLRTNREFFLKKDNLKKKVINVNFKTCLSFRLMAFTST